MKPGKNFVAKLSLLPLVFVVAAAISCDSQMKEAWETAPLKDGPLEVVKLDESSGLKVERIRFRSLELNEFRFCLVLLPKTGEVPQRVLIVNHGWADRPEYLLQYLHLDQIYARLLAEGVVKPAILVLPDIRFALSERKNSASVLFPKYLPLIAEEVCFHISQRYHVPVAKENWGITGFSFGGYLSLDIGRRYAGRFGSIGAISSPHETDWLFWSSKVSEETNLDSKGRGRQTIIEPGPIPRIFLACGTSDRYFKDMTQLHNLFQEHGIAHVWSTGPGGHTWKYWDSVLEKLLKFHLGI
jgi:enterochelin esterase-like enzyme